MIVGVDFDGTIVEHNYPQIGERVPGSIETLLDLQKQGHRLILWTMRSGHELEAARVYLAELGVHLWAVNINPDQKKWTNSPKAYCQIYIDDEALGCPLLHHERALNRRPFVDWWEVRRKLIETGVLVNE